MKVRKNFEAVFLAAAVMANFTAFAIAEEPAKTAKPAAVQAVVVDGNMHVVVVKAKRLTAAEKAALN